MGKKAHASSFELCVSDCESMVMCLCKCSLLCVFFLCVIVCLPECSCSCLLLCECLYVCSLKILNLLMKYVSFYAYVFICVIL